MPKTTISLSVENPPGGVQTAASAWSPRACRQNNDTGENDPAMGIP